MTRKTVWWLLLAALIVVVDQATKFVVVRHMSVNQVIEVTSFFNLVLVYNPGAAFSFLASHGGWQRTLFTVIATVASIWIIYLLHRYPGQRLFAFSLVLILGGAIGNLIDRITVGAVIDFLDFHGFGYHWPAFNVADSGITCGAVLLVYDALRPRRKA